LVLLCCKVGHFISFRIDVTLLSLEESAARRWHFFNFLCWIWCKDPIRLQHILS
jgi:hypothetical protein